MALPVSMTEAERKKQVFEQSQLPPPSQLRPWQISGDPMSRAKELYPDRPDLQAKYVAYAKSGYSDAEIYGIIQQTQKVQPPPSEDWLESWGRSATTQQREGDRALQALAKDKAGKKSIDEQIQNYLEGLTTGLAEERRLGEEAIQREYEQIAPKVAMSVKEGRRSLDTGGYQRAKMRTTSELETARIRQLTDLARIYTQLQQQGYGTALQGALGLRGQDLQNAIASGQLGISQEQLGLAKEQLVQSKKEWEDKLATIAEQLGLQKEQFTWEKQLPYIQRGWEIEDRPYYKNLAKTIASYSAPSPRESALSWIRSLTPLSKIL